MPQNCPKIPTFCFKYYRHKWLVSVWSLDQASKLIICQLGLWHSHIQFDLITALMKYHWLICDQIINALPRIGWIFTGYLDGTLIKGCVCFGGVADWVWGAKRSKESHRLGCHYGSLQNWSTVFCGAWVVWCYVRFWILQKCQKSQNQYWQMRLWVPKQGNLSQPSPTARVSVAPVRMEIPSLVCTTVHYNHHQSTTPKY